MRAILRGGDRLAVAKRVTEAVASTLPYPLNLASSRRTQITYTCRYMAAMGQELTFPPPEAMSSLPQIATKYAGAG